MHSTAGGLPFSILQKASDFLTLLASLLLCHSVTLPCALDKIDPIADKVRIGWMAKPRRATSHFTAPHPWFHCVEGPTKWTGLVGPSAYSSILKAISQGSRSSPSKQGQRVAGGGRSRYVHLNAGHMGNRTDQSMWPIIGSPCLVSR